MLKFCLIWKLSKLTRDQKETFKPIKHFWPRWPWWTRWPLEDLGAEHCQEPSEVKWKARLKVCKYRFLPYRCHRRFQSNKVGNIWHQHQHEYGTWRCPRITNHVRQGPQNDILSLRWFGQQKKFYRIYRRWGNWISSIRLSYPLTNDHTLLTI